jgi:hypothetical protein
MPLGIHRTDLTVFVLISIVLLGFVFCKSQPVRDGDGWGRTQTHNSLKQLSLACHSANDVFKRLPPAFDRFGKMQFAASMHVHLLPFIEEDKLYQKYIDERGVGDAADYIVLSFVRPEDGSGTNWRGIQNHGANLRIFSDKGVETKWDTDMPALGPIEPGNQAIPRTFGDGTSNTIVFVTKLAVCGDGGSRYVAAPDSAFAAYFGQNAAAKKAHPTDPRATFQLQPGPGQCLTSPLMAQSMSQSGLSVALADGHVRVVGPDLSPRTWNLLVHPSDGMELGDDWQD